MCWACYTNHALYLSSWIYFRISQGSYFWLRQWLACYSKLLSIFISSPCSVLRDLFHSLGVISNVVRNLCFVVSIVCQQKRVVSLLAWSKRDEKIKTSNFVIVIARQQACFLMVLCYCCRWSKQKPVQKTQAPALVNSTKFVGHILKPGLFPAIRPKPRMFTTVKFPQSNSPLERGGEPARRGVFCRWLSEEVTK